MAGDTNDQSASSPLPKSTQSDIIPLLSDVEIGFEDSEKQPSSLSKSEMAKRSSRFHGAPLQTDALMQEIKSPHYDGFNSPTSPKQWPASAKEPLLAGEEAIQIDSGNVEVIDPQPKAKRIYISEEYKLALSHFRVGSPFLTGIEFMTKTVYSEYFLTLIVMTNYSSSQQAELQCSPVLHYLL